MPNIVNTQIVLDGPRNTVVKVVGTLDTSDLAPTVFITPSTLAGIDNTGNVKAKTLILMEANHNIEEGLAVLLGWEGSPSMPLLEMNGQDTGCYKDFGGLVNNAIGRSGNITIATQGWSGVMSFTLVLSFVKQERL